MMNGESRTDSHNCRMELSMKHARFGMLVFALGVLLTTALPAHAQYSGRLYAPDRIWGGNMGEGFITSPNYSYSFVMQRNCDVAQYRYNWQTGLNEYTGWRTETDISNTNASCFMAMQ